MSDTTTQSREPRTHPPGARGRRPGDADAVAEFERLYRAEIDAVTAYFARRSSDPGTVADLTADTFVAAITSFGSFDPRRGAPRAWLFGIARRVFAAHCAAADRDRERTTRLAGRRELDRDDFEELLDRIDAERAGRSLVSELTELPDLDRAVVELVDLVGLSAREASEVLGVSPGAARIRLMRARARLRKTQAHESEQEEKS